MSQTQNRNNSHMYDFEQIRTVLLEGQRWLCLPDAVSALGGYPDVDTIRSTVQRVAPAHVRMVEMGTETSSAMLPVVTTIGLAQYLRLTADPDLVTAHDAILSAELDKCAAVKVRVSAFSDGTRWGAQPFRVLLRDMHVSVEEFTKLLNMHRVPPEPVITRSAVNSLAMGRQLPKPYIVRCMERVLVTTPDKLFTEPLLAKFTEKFVVAHPNPAALRLSLPAPSPSTPDRDPRIVDLPPHLQSSPEEIAREQAAFAADSLDDTEDDGPIDWDAEDEKMKAAFAEAVGAPSFEAGFALVTGSSPLSTPSSTPPSDRLEHQSDSDSADPDSDGM